MSVTPVRSLPHGMIAWKLAGVDCTNKRSGQIDRWTDSWAREKSNAPELSLLVCIKVVTRNIFFVRRHCIHGSASQDWQLVGKEKRRGQVVRATRLWCRRSQEGSQKIVSSNSGFAMWRLKTLSANGYMYRIREDDAVKRAWFRFLFTCTR